MGPQPCEVRAALFGYLKIAYKRISPSEEALYATAAKALLSRS